MLSFDDDGDVEDHCTDLDGDCGHTHYQFEAVDENGKRIASEQFETRGMFTTAGPQFFQSVFTAESGEMTISITLGRVDGNKFKAMSDTASVRFEAPDDLRALDQTYAEYNAVNTDIVASVDEVDDIESFRDSIFAAEHLSGYKVGDLLKDDATVKGQTKAN